MTLRTRIDALERRAAALPTAARPPRLRLGERIWTADELQQTGPDAQHWTPTQAAAVRTFLAEIATRAGRSFVWGAGSYGDGDYMSDPDVELVTDPRSSTVVTFIHFVRVEPAHR